MTHGKLPLEVSLVGRMLRNWRISRGLSQAALARRASVSARHISFLETGRSQPSRAMVLGLGQCLEIPLRECNPLLVAAGFAPVYDETPYSDPALEAVRAGLRHLLAAHNPYPAVVVDRLWNIIEMNPAFDAWFDAFPTLASPRLDNYLHIFLSPGGLKEYISNWGPFAGALWHRFLQQIEHAGTDLPLHALHSNLQGLPGVEELVSRPERGEYDLCIPLDMVRAGKTLSWFSTTTAFTTPRDITLQELHIESLFPANAEAQTFAQDAFANRKPI